QKPDVIEALETALKNNSLPKGVRALVKQVLRTFAAGNPKKKNPTITLKKAALALAGALVALDSIYAPAAHAAVQLSDTAVHAMFGGPFDLALKIVGLAIGGLVIWRGREVTVRVLKSTLEGVVWASQASAQSLKAL